MEKKVKLESHEAKVDPVFKGSWSGRERDCLFHNADVPGAAYPNAAWVAALDFDDDGRSAIPVDVDGDGDLDLALLSLQGLRLVLNQSPPRHWSRVRLKATTTHPSALNAQVSLRAGGVTRTRFVVATEGFQSQLPLDVHFGVGEAALIDSVVVRWPSGKIEEHADLPVDRLLEITEGSGAVGKSELKRWAAETVPPVRPAAPPPPPSAALLDRVGMRLNQVGLEGEALELFERSAALDSNRALTQYHLGLGYSFKGDPGRALVHLRRSVDLDPGAWSARYNLGVHLYNAGRAAEAVEHYEAAVRLRPDDVELLCALGDAAAASKQGAIADVAFTRALALAPGNATVLGLRGRFLLSVGQVAAAKDLFQRALAIDPNEPVSRAHMRDIEKLEKESR